MAKSKEEIAAEKAELKAQKAAAKAAKEAEKASKGTGKKGKEAASPEKKGKKKKTYTVEEILAAGNSATEGEDGKKKRIHVKTKSKLKAREARMGYIFTFPYLVGMIWLSIYPIYSAIRVSFMKYLSFMGITKEDFAGLKNYQDVLTYETNLISDLGVYVFKMVLATPLIVVFALLMAMLLNSKVKGTGIFRTIFFLPVIVVSGPVMGMLQGSGNIDAVDTTAITAMVTGSMPPFLADAITYVFTNIVMFLWYSGVQILIFLSALQKIDSAMYEAAKIDGASGWECFWKITLPTIRPFIVLNGVYTLVNLSQDTNVNTLINKIQNVFYDASKGRGYFSAYALFYTIVVLLLTILVAVILMPKRDIYAKQIAKNKRLEKKALRNIKKTEKRMVRNQKKYAKHLEKQARLKEQGKLEEQEEGGRLDG